MGILFISSLIIGAAIGILIKFGMIGTPPPPQPTPTPTLISIADHNPLPDPKILVIGVKDLNAQETILVSIWFVSQESSTEDGVPTIKFTMKTIYPVVQSMGQTPSLTPYTQPHEPIWIKAKDLDSITSLIPLVAADVKWNEIVVIDEYFMNSAINLADRNEPDPLATPPPDRFFNPWEDPQGAYIQQVNILTNLCAHPDAYFEFMIADTLFKMYQTHIVSSLTADDMRYMWQINNLDDATITCSFDPEP